MRTGSHSGNHYIILTCVLNLIGILFAITGCFFVPSGNQPVYFIIFIGVQIGSLITLCFGILPHVKQLYQFLSQLTDRIESSGVIPDDEFSPDLIETYTGAVLKKYEQQLIRKQAGLSALQSQINPHFLYNTLDSIRGQALEYNIPEIADMTEALSSFFRYNVSKGSDMVPLRDEIRNIQTYFKIQQYRFENRFSLRIDNEDVRVLDYYLPKLTLQPIVENCIFHGLEKKSEHGHIVIKLTMTQTRLLITIIDDGFGISHERLIAIQEILRKGEPTQSSSSGIALSNVSERIKLAFGPIYGLFISSQAGVGTEVEITLPLINKLEEINTQL